ncbi:MAG: lysophospholipid acyltransferase family protein [Muribaculaceae bacterium]|nr:lysophospholipid acyltransferase family protein [Muribaculaceae bacterium]
MKEKFLYFIYYGVCRSLACLPFRLLYILSDILAFILGRVVGYRRKVVRRNISEVFPQATPERLREIERGFYSQLCDTIVESVKLLHVSDRQLASRIRVEGSDTVQATGEERIPIILFTAHFANWEWVPYIQYTYTEPRISGEIYKPARDEAFNRLMTKIRNRFPSVLITQHQAYRECLSLAREYGTFVIGFVADHRPNSKIVPLHIEFLGHNTPFNVGGEKIGRKVGARYFYLDITKESRGHYLFRFLPVIPDEKEKEMEYPYTAAYTRLLAANILRQPQLWLWSHRRWLFK